MKYWILLFLLFSPALHASALPPEIRRALLESGIPPDHVGIYVMDVSKQKALVSWHENRPMSPASTMKLVTTYAALSVLGPAYTWKTEAYHAGKIEKGVLDGPLILKGYGDPELDIARLWLFVRKLRALGIKEIRGGLVFDRSFFDFKGNPGFDSEPYRPYNVVPDALLVNFEAVGVDFVPDGPAVKLIIQPDFSSLVVENRLKAVAGPCHHWSERISEKMASSGKAASLELEGDFPSSCGEREDEFALYDHSEYLYQLFSMLWQESGGIIGGGWREGSVPPDAQLLAETESRPLSSLIVDMNKYSNNVMARQIFLTMGSLERIPATEDSARTSVESWLKDKGFFFPELVMENGSGLSRRERISPLHMTELIRAAYFSPLMPAFFSSLPVAGIDGTMKKRLKSTEARGRAWIKTGSLDGVRAIAGIVQGRSGKRYAVTCFVNDNAEEKAKSFENALVVWLANRP